jgi:hypothetical protein
MKNLANIYYMQQVEETPNKILSSTPLKDSSNSKTIPMTEYLKKLQSNLPLNEKLIANPKMINGIFLVIIV